MEDNQKYISKPQIIEAFQFRGHETQAPEWFVREMKEGRVSVTMSHKENCINIYGEKLHEKVLINDWFCRIELPNGRHKNFALDDESFKDHWKEWHNGNTRKV